MSDNVVKFKNAIEKLQSMAMPYQAEARYMSDMSNWLTVHATKYMPRRDENGNMYIPSTAMARNFASVPRNTVHTTMNHVVASHFSGNWDTMPIVILAPFNSVTQKNGNPAEVAGTDTYWSVDPDKGFQLPPDAVIIKPDNNGPVYNVDGNIVTYKTDNYTPAEVQQILSMLSEEELQKYNRYMRGELNEVEMMDVLWTDPVVKKAYDNAKDKAAFLRGYMEEARYEILTHFLRNAVIKLTMQNMGYNYVQCYDLDDNSQAIAETANANGLDGNMSNKGHSHSVYKSMEEEYQRFDNAVNGGIFDSGLYNAKDAEELYSAITKMSTYMNPDEFLSAIVSGKAPDLYSDFVHRFEYFKEQRKLKHQTIAEFDPFLDKTLHRTAQEVEKTFIQWMDKIKQWPDYDKLISKLKSYQMAQHMQRAGHEL